MNMPWKKPSDAPSGSARSGGGHINLSFLNGSKIVVLVVMGLLTALWVLSGFYTISESDRGVVLRFGKYVNTVQPGLN